MCSGKCKCKSKSDFRDRSRAKYREKMDEMKQWIVYHHGDVDCLAFDEACEEIYAYARSGYGIRTSEAVHRVSGILKLDAACALMGEFVPSEILKYFPLP